MNIGRIPQPRALIDRRALVADIAALVEDRGAGARSAVVERLRAALAEGRTEIARRLEARPGHGYESAAAQAYLIDQ